jgi:3-(3-hydroxy-phenyl)propionate hydroxylase
VLTVGDEQGRLKDWFSAQGKSVVFVRPDRFVAALASPQEVSAVTRHMARVLHSPLEA